MKIKLLKRLAAILMILLTVFFYACDSVPVAAYMFGSSGSQIKEIQKRLKDWGYYFGYVDGNYGKETENAVIWFQQKNHITVDGIVGAQTAEKLGVAAPSESSKKTTTSSDVYLLAKVVYGEARGEPYTGKVAVAAVVLNRVASSLFPNTIAKVVYQPGAFSIVDDGQIDLSPDAEALKAAKDAMNGWDPSGGAIFYYNPDKTSNAYITSRPVICTIGDHIFCE
jgi:N-acetylmuramoyl-L-alanine amidase